MKKVTAAQVKKLEQICGKLDLLENQLPVESKATDLIRAGKRKLIDALMIVSRDGEGGSQP